MRVKNALDAAQEARAEYEYLLALHQLRESVMAAAAASQAAGRSREWFAGYIAGSGKAYSEAIQEANRAFFEEAWPPGV